MGSAEDAVRPPAAGGMAARLRAARRRSFVGRRTELDLFGSALEQDPPPFAVLHVHGPAGVGKSALLGRFADEARSAGRPVTWVDGRDVEASPAGVQSALASRLDVDPDDTVSALAAEPAPVLLLDTYELLGAVDDWVRLTLIPRLSREALVVLAGRQPPGSGWRSDPGWDELLRVVALRDLHADEAHALLDARGVEPSRHGDALAIAHGHPLALVLVSDVLRGHDEGPFSLDDAREVMVPLLRRYLGRLPGEAHRWALYATAHAGFATEALLRDTVHDESAGALFDWLGGLSFTEPVTSGVALHELVGELLDADLRWRDPDGYVDLHRRVVDHLFDRAFATTGAERDRAMLDIFSLYRRNPITGSFYDAGRTGQWLEPATPADHEVILAMTRKHEGEASAAIAEYWLQRQPEAFTALREGTGGPPVGFIAHLLLDVPGDEIEVDSVAAAAWDHVRASAPLRPGECIRLMRFWMSDDSHQAPATFPLVSTRVNVDYLATEGLAWAFGAIVDADFYEPAFQFVGYHRATSSDITVGDHVVGLFARDMRQMPFRRWWKLLTNRVASSAEELAQLPQPEQRLLVLAHEDFRDAVRDALRGLARPDGLDGSPLLRSRVVVEHAGDGSPAEALRDLLEQAIAELADDPRDDRPHRALDRTYLRPAPTQEAAAEVLGLPFSTFRRHLTAGVDHVTARLWERELHGRPEPA